MTRRYRLGIAGLVHDHVWNELKHWAGTGHVQFIAAADPNPPLLDRAVRDFGVEQTFADVGEMFDRCRLDVVQVCTSNAGAAPVVEQATRRGIHAVVEKPMAATLEQAERMLAAAEQGGVMLMINWPFRWRANTPHAWKMVADGVIGEVFAARVRMAHKGPREFGCSDFFCGWLYDKSQNGGGAIIDYCSYGAVAFRYLFGMPSAVQAVAGRLVKTDIDVDDNAAITLIYENRHAVAEASWSQVPSYHDSVFLGTRGTLWTEAETLKLATEDDMHEITVELLPQGERNGPEYFLKCLENETPPAGVCSPTVCRDAQEILEAGVRSNESGSRVALPLR